MANISALTMATRLNNQITGILVLLDVDIIGRETSKTIERIKRLAGDVRLDVRDWEMSDDRAEMDSNARAGRQRIEELRAQILQASEHGIFGAVDVVHLSAQLDAIAAELR